MVGTRIRVTNRDGSAHVEEVVEWQPDRRVRLRMGEFSAPLSRLATEFVGTWEFERNGEKTRVTRSFEPHPKWRATRPVLWLISLPLRRTDLTVYCALDGANPKWDDGRLLRHESYADPVREDEPPPTARSPVRDRSRILRRGRSRVRRWPSRKAGTRVPPREWSARTSRSNSRASTSGGSGNKRTFPSDEQLGHFKRYLAAGKPFVGYRAASHVFQNWLEVDQQVFGATYGGHHLLNKEKNPGLNIELMTGAAEHPILKGLEPPKPASGSYSYTKLADDVTVLLKSGLPGDMMPHTWVREHAKTKNRVFYTRYDAKELATNETCRAIFLRGVAWALGSISEETRRKG